MVYLGIKSSKIAGHVLENSWNGHPIIFIGRSNAGPLNTDIISDSIDGAVFPDEEPAVHRESPLHQ